MNVLEGCAFMQGSCIKILLCVIFILCGRASFAGNPCYDDTERLCAGARGTQAGVSRCLAEYLSELSPDCAERIAAIYQERNEPLPLSEPETQEIQKIKTYPTSPFSMFQEPQPQAPPPERKVKETPTLNCAGFDWYKSGCGLH